MRADVALVARGLFPSRAKAAEAILAGLVSKTGRIVLRPSEDVGVDERLQATAPYPWVSRGGVKLAAALDTFSLDVSGRTCLDVGASTGGFTDVLLARGAAHVTAVDVGTAQIHARIAANPRVRVWEQTDARTLKPADVTPPPTVVVADVSFISLTLILPSVLALASPRADFVALVKPQFEGARTKKGIVREDAERAAALRRVADCAHALGWCVEATMPSPIAGGDGNIEFLLHARRDL